MKNIQLKKLELTNYRNIPYAVYEFNGNSKIIGDNRVGKTNTLESICYLLTDKLLDGSSDVSAIKPLNDTKLEVSVKATFNIDDKEVTLEKRYKESWVKTRGTTNLEMKGHTVTWLYNDVKQSTLRAYEQMVADDFGFTQDAKTKINFMQMLINPYYLGNIGEDKDWTELRAFIINLIGDVSDDDVVNAKPELARIKEDLKVTNGRIDQLKKKYSGEIDGLETDIVSDDALINMLSETPNPTDDEVSIAKKGIEEHQDKINSLKNSNGLDVASMELEKKINEKKLQLSELERNNLLLAQNNPEKVKLREGIDQLQHKQAELTLINKIQIQNKLRKYERDLTSSSSELERNKQHRSFLISSIKKIDEELSNVEVATTCPHCGKPYDEDEIESKKAEIITELNEKKDTLISDGKVTRKAIDELESNIDLLKNKIQEEENNLKNLDDEFSSIVSEKEELQEKLDNFVETSEPNPEIENLKAEITKLEEELRASRENYYKGTQNTQQLIFEEQEAMKPFNKVISDREYFNRQQERLLEIQSQKEEHQRKLADVEQAKELLNQFIYTKLRLLDNNVHKVFGNIRFQLIKENINGGFDAVCKPYIYDPILDKSTDTTWRSGSKSERIVTGVAIVEAIKRKLNLPNLPYLFDEGGEVSTDTLSTRLKTDSQLICVRVVDNINKPLVQNL